MKQDYWDAFDCDRGFEIFKLIRLIGLVAFGERFNSFSEKEENAQSRSSTVISAAYNSNSGIFKLDKGFIWKFINTPLYRKLADAQSYLENVSKQILLRKANYFDKFGNSAGYSLIDKYLQQSNLDLKDITGMMVDILMGAMDTTSYTMSFLFYYLALNPRCQQELYTEARNLLPESNTDITPEILARASYVRSCVKECLRLNPVSIGIGRILPKDIVLKDYKIPKNTVIITHNMVASRLPQYVKDPLTFRPERWMRGNKFYENIHPFLSLPFGFGPRSCIARRLAEQTICIAALRMIREFEFKWKGKELGIRTHLINKPDQAIRLSLIPRATG